MADEERDWLSSLGFFDRGKGGYAITDLKSPPRSLQRAGLHERPPSPLCTKVQSCKHPRGAGGTMSALDLDRLGRQMARPSDLARRVHRELARLNLTALPPIPLLTALFDATFFASLRRDEASAVLFEVVWIDPDNPDPDPPPVIRPHRWRFFPFGDPIPLTPANLIKVARATDGRTSSLAYLVLASKTCGLSVWLMKESVTEGRESLPSEGSCHQAFSVYPPSTWDDLLFTMRCRR